MYLYYTLTYHLVLYRTATKDGQIMANLLSFFKTQEHSRFRAFKRSAFSTNTIKDWLAVCLSQHYSLGTVRRLEDWVIPGQVDSIGATAAALAKVYAQRLVRAAMELRQKDDAQKSSSDTAVDIHRPLSPQWIRQAWEERTRQGLDPGFFLQPPSDAALQWCHPLHSDFEQRRLAALAAQDAYDAHTTAESAMDTTGD
jgi:hypothetical protein